MGYISGDFRRFACRFCGNCGSLFCDQIRCPMLWNGVGGALQRLLMSTVPASSIRFSPRIDAGTDRMSRLPWLFASLLMCVSAGCMNQPMYQPGYGQPMYGQPMYGPGGYSQPGTLVVPPSNAPAYVPGSTYDSNPNDDFKSNDTSKDPRYFGGEGDGNVPTPRDPNVTEPFSRDLTP